MRTKDYSYIENYAVRPPALDLPLDIEDSLSGKALGTEHLAVRAPPRELYDLRADPDEKINLIDRPEVSAIQAELSSQLHTWRAKPTIVSRTRHWEARWRCTAWRRTSRRSVSDPTCGPPTVRTAVTSSRTPKTP